MFTVDYTLNDDPDTIIEEQHDTPQQAERRARHLSKKHHRGGYDGPVVYVFKTYGARGQKTFFAGAVQTTEDDYNADVAPFKN